MTLCCVWARAYYALHASERERDFDIHTVKLSMLQPIHKHSYHRINLNPLKTMIIPYP